MTSEQSDFTDISAPSGELSFEEAYRQLAGIAERLEAGGLTLAEATACYKQGMMLVQQCNHLLDSAELEITTLRDSSQRAAVSAPFSGNDAPPPLPEDAPYDGAGYDEEDELPF